MEVCKRPLAMKRNRGGGEDDVNSRDQEGNTNQQTLTYPQTLH
jgi:hypothetical protein